MAFPMSSGAGAARTMTCMWIFQFNLSTKTLISFLIFKVESYPTLQLHHQPISNQHSTVQDVETLTGCAQRGQVEIFKIKKNF